MPKPEIKALIFDMGHVFVDFEWEEVCMGFCREFNMSLDDFKPLLKQIGSIGYETGKADTIRLLDEVERVTKIKLAEERFHALWNHTFRENDSMTEILTVLKSKYPLFLLSNTNESHWNFLESTYRVSRHFQELVLSFEVGYAKPQEEIYRHTVEKTGLNPENCVFIDDLPVNIEAADKVGLQTIQFESSKDMVRKLQEMGVSLF